MSSSSPPLGKRCRISLYWRPACPKSLVHTQLAPNPHFSGQYAKVPQAIFQTREHRRYVQTRFSASPSSSQGMRARHPCAFAQWSFASLRFCIPAPPPGGTLDSPFHEVRLRLPL